MRWAIWRINWGQCFELRIPLLPNELQSQTSTSLINHSNKNGALWLSCQEFLVHNVQTAIYSLPPVFDLRDKGINDVEHRDPNYPTTFPPAPWRLDLTQKYKRELIINDIHLRQPHPDRGDHLHQWRFLPERLLGSWPHSGGARRWRQPADIHPFRWSTTSWSGCG